jgi:hypothetical protein
MPVLDALDRLERRRLEAVHRHGQRSTSKVPRRCFNCQAWHWNSPAVASALCWPCRADIWLYRFGAPGDEADL